MFFRVAIIFAVCWSGAFAAKNFWNNDICTSNSDCSGLLDSCDLTFGCSVSGPKVAFLSVGIFVGLVAIFIGILCLCGERIRNTSLMRSYYRYRTPTVVTTTTTDPWTHQQMSTTTVYPHNPHPDQFYANSVNTPMINQFQVDTMGPPMGGPMGPTMGPTIGPYNQPMNPMDPMPTAPPYDSVGYGVTKK